MSAAQRAAEAAGRMTRPPAWNPRRKRRFNNTLGVIVQHGTVWQPRRPSRTWPLTGACAGVIGQPRLTAGRIAMAALFNGSDRTPVTAFIQFADGTRITRAVRGDRAQEAMECAAAFNAMADAVQDDPEESA